MADYPDVCQDSSTRLIPLSSIKMNYSESGVQRSVNSSINTKYSVSIIHIGLSESEKESIITHYDDNKSQSFIFYYKADLNYYKLAYKSKPRQSKNGSVWSVSSSMDGVKIGLTLNLVTSGGSTVTYLGEPVTSS